MPEIGLSGSMRRMWKRSDGLAIEAPLDERGGNSRLNLRPPRHILTLPEAVSQDMNIQQRSEAMVTSAFRLTGSRYPFHFSCNAVVISATDPLRT